MAHKNSRKKNRDAKREEKLQEHHNKFMESLRSLVSGEVFFLFPAMAGISHLSKLGEEVQALLLVGFLCMGYISAIALILSHCTDAMRCSAVVSVMAWAVTIFCLGIFHLAIGLLTPDAYWEGSVLFNILLFVSTTLMISFLWKRFFESPQCEEKMPDAEVNGEDSRYHVNLQERHNKLMESLRSLLSGEVFFLLPAMAGISNLDKLGEVHQTILLATFLVIGHIGTVGLLVSHSTNSMGWSAFVSKVTLSVTVYWLAIFHLAIGLLTPEAYQEACAYVNFFLFLCGIRMIAFLWEKFIHPKGTKCLPFIWFAD